MLAKVSILLAVINVIVAVELTDSTELEKPKRSCNKNDYFDKIKQRSKNFPGGGSLVMIDHSAKCAEGDRRLHKLKRDDMYYVCHPRGVMIGMCPTNMIFCEPSQKCIKREGKRANTIRVYDESENCNVRIPSCKGVGRFAVPSNRSFYIDCEEHDYGYYQYVYRCPHETKFNPELKRCTAEVGCKKNKDDYLKRFDDQYFPKCVMRGQFRTSKDCNLYYQCTPNLDGSYFQIRFECPPSMYYDVETERCQYRESHECQYVSLDQILKDYAAKHNLPCSVTTAAPTTIGCPPRASTTTTTQEPITETSPPCYTETHKFKPFRFETRLAQPEENQQPLVQYAIMMNGQAETTATPEETTTGTTTEESSPTPTPSTTSESSTSTPSTLSTRKCCHFYPGPDSIDGVDPDYWMDSDERLHSTSCNLTVASTTPIDSTTISSSSVSEITTPVDATTQEDVTSTSSSTSTISSTTQEEATTDLTNTTPIDTTSSTLTVSSTTQETTTELTETTLADSTSTSTVSSTSQKETTIELTDTTPTESSTVSTTADIPTTPEETTTEFTETSPTDPTTESSISTVGSTTQEETTPTETTTSSTTTTVSSTTQEETTPTETTTSSTTTTVSSTTQEETTPTETTTSSTTTTVSSTTLEETTPTETTTSSTTTTVSSTTQEETTPTETTTSSSTTTVSSTTQEETTTPTETISSTSNISSTAQETTNELTETTSSDPTSERITTTQEETTTELTDTTPTESSTVSIEATTPTTPKEATTASITSTVSSTTQEETTSEIIETTTASSTSTVSPATTPTLSSSLTTPDATTPCDPNGIEFPLSQDELALNQDTTNAPDVGEVSPTENPVRCILPGDSQINCNGELGTGQGKMVIPGYIIRLKQKTRPGLTPNPNLDANIRLKLKYPHSYRFEAFARGPVKC